MPFPLITEKSRLTDALHAPTLHTTTARDGLQPFPPPTERAGTLLGNRYKLTQLLGRGGHGLVFGATDTQTQAEVAIKLLARTEEDTDHSRRFLREADILARLHHPNTVRVFDRGQSADGTMFLVMERVDGHSLEATLRHRQDNGEVLSEADATAIAVQVLDSLTEAHALGLVHRDIKPSNIMLDDRDGKIRAKVLDFGIAQTQESSLTATGKVMGTPTYMSPEQCLGLELDGRTDLYALAAMLYRCVSGRSPFDDPNALTVMYNHVNVPARDLASVAKTAVSAGFVDVVMRALAKAPEQRFLDAAVMRQALERAGETPDGAPVRSATTHTVSPLRLPAVRPPAELLPDEAPPNRSRVTRMTAVPWVIAALCVAALIAGRSQSSTAATPTAVAQPAAATPTRVLAPLSPVPVLAVPVVTTPATPPEPPHAEPNAAATAKSSVPLRTHRRHVAHRRSARPEDPQTILPPD